jgi:hypothetical protein
MQGNGVRPLDRQRGFQRLQWRFSQAADASIEISFVPYYLTIAAGKLRQDRSRDVRNGRPRPEYGDNRKTGYHQRLASEHRTTRSHDLIDPDRYTAARRPAAVLWNLQTRRPPYYRSAGVSGQTRQCLVASS